MSVKSEVPESDNHWDVTYWYLGCPFCKIINIINPGNLSDETVADIEACQCHGCSKKFWIPGQKEIQETNAGFGFDPQTAEELGLDLGEDLIELAFCEKGMPEKD